MGKPKPIFFAKQILQMNSQANSEVEPLVVLECCDVTSLETSGVLLGLGANLRGVNTEYTSNHVDI